MTIPFMPVGFMQTADVTVDSWYCENAGKRVDRVAGSSNQIVSHLEGSFTSAMYKVLLTSSANIVDYLRRVLPKMLPNVKPFGISPAKPQCSVDWQSIIKVWEHRIPDPLVKQRVDISPVSY